MPALEIRQFPCLSDNFGVILRDPATNTVAASDAPEDAAVEAALKAAGWTLTHILVTHHHADHTDGIAALKARYNATVIGPKNDAAKIAGLDKTVGGGDSFKLGQVEVRVLDTPGHTLGHITFWMPEAKAAFVGDTLFSIGCGRVFEGTPAQMSASLARLAALPDDTLVHCAHEYTASNLRFARAVEPSNAALAERDRETAALRAAGTPTVPSTLALERATNPFLRADAPEVVAAARTRLGRTPDDAVEVFATVRQWKDGFRG